MLDVNCYIVFVTREVFLGTFENFINVDFDSLSYQIQHLLINVKYGENYDGAYFLALQFSVHSDFTVFNKRSDFFPVFNPYQTVGGQWE